MSHFPLPRYKFHLDYTLKSAPAKPHQPQSIPDEYYHPPGFPATQSAYVPLPPFPPQTASTSPPTDSTTNETPSSTPSQHAMRLAYRQSWTVAFSHVRTLFTTSVALYLSGRRVQAFSIATTLTILFMHIGALFSVRSSFKPVFRIYPLSIPSVLPQFLLHLAFCTIGVFVGLYKANTLGFLPTTQSDWIALLPAHTLPLPRFRHPPLIN